VDDGRCAAGWQSLQPDPAGRLEPPHDRDEDDPALLSAGAHDRSRWPGCAEAQVADVRLEFVEGEGEVRRVVVDLIGRDELRRDGPHDDVPSGLGSILPRDRRLLGHGDRDLQRLQPPLDLEPLALELGAAPLQDDAQVGASRDEPGDSPSGTPTSRSATIRSSSGNCAGE
jgi:hypothetical protein